MKLELLTERLRLSAISMKDLDDIHGLHRLPETDEFNALGIPENMDETKAIVEDWIAKSQSTEQRRFTFKIELIDSRMFVGLIGLMLGKPKYKSGEVWYKLHVNFWGKGYATESLNRILAFAFDDLNLHRIEAGCAVENIGSIRVLEKVKMTREGRKRQVLPLKNGWSDNFHYAILSSDFENHRSLNRK